MTGGDEDELGRAVAGIGMEEYGFVQTLGDWSAWFLMLLSIGFGESGVFEGGKDWVWYWYRCGF